MAAAAVPFVVPTVVAAGDLIVAGLSAIWLVGFCKSAPIAVKAAAELAATAGSAFGGTAAGAGAGAAGAGAAGAGAAGAGTATAGGTAATTTGTAATVIGAPVLIPAAAVVAAGIYLSKQTPNIPPQPSAPPRQREQPHQAEPREPESEDEETKEPKRNKKEELSNRKRDKIFIDRRTLGKLLSSQGREIYERLRKVTPDQLRNIWTDPKGNFRVDPGARSTANPRIKTWNLQVNRKATSNAARSLKNRYGTHKKLIWGEIDTVNPPPYETWVLEILNRLI